MRAIALLCLACVAAFSQAQGNGQYRWDFGSGSGSTATTGWNTIADTAVGDTTTAFTVVDTAGTSTGITLRFSTAPTSFGTGGYPGQTNTPYPQTATQDYMTCSGAATIVWTISGLTAPSYSLRFFSNRNTTSTGRVGQWTTHDAQSVTVDSASTMVNRVSSTPGNIYQYGQLNNVAPVGGVITVTMRGASSGIAFLNVMELVAGNFPTVTASASSTSITLPRTVQVSASASSTAGSIVSYAWDSVRNITTANTSFDNTPLFDDPTAASTRMNAILPGTAIPIVTVTDSTGRQSWAAVSITVAKSTVSVARKLAIIGSSTSQGAYALNIIPSYITSLNALGSVDNGSASGQSSCALRPTVPANGAGCFGGQNLTGNITWAIGKSPNVILMQLASNDCNGSGGATVNRAVEDQKAAYLEIAAAARAAGIPLFVTTTQPLGIPGATIPTVITQCQITMRDWIKATFGRFAVDFWTGLAYSDSSMLSTGIGQLPAYASTDGVHFNTDLGHPKLAGRLIESGIFEETVTPARAHSGLLPIR